MDEFRITKTNSLIVMAKSALVLTICITAFSSCGSIEKLGPIETIHQQFIFVDMHAHPSRFHRANIEHIDKTEIARYQKQMMDLVVCSISSDAAYQGGYMKRDGTRIERLQGNEVYDLQPGVAFGFTMDRLLRIIKTVDSTDAVLALNPSVVMEVKEKGQVALLPALEGADGLEGKIENLNKLHQEGLRLLQLLHFRDNELGFNQTKPYLAGGLTEFGKEVVRECNRLGIIVDLAHSNTQTILNALAISEHPMIFSHGGVKALTKGDRDLTDDEIRAIAEKGGIIGIWPNGKSLPGVEDMVRHIDHVKKLVGVDHIGIGSDLRGMSKYTKEFGPEANFGAIAEALLKNGYSQEDVGKIMGGNFFRVWQQISNDSDFKS